jgi:hypothetical protein
VLQVGHVLYILSHFLELGQNYRAETNDATDLGSHFVKKRTLKSEKRAATGTQDPERKGEVFLLSN